VTSVMPRELGRIHGRFFWGSNLAGQPAGFAACAWFNLLALHPRLCAGGTGLSYAAGRRNRVEASAFVVIVILVIGTVALEKIGSSESFKADITSEPLSKCMGSNVSLEMLGA
jgi:hypothetical protein